MKILIVTGIFPPDIGGPATYVPRMAAALTERGHIVAVITLSDNSSSASNSYPFSVTRLPRPMFKPWRWLLTVMTIFWLGRRADILFVNGLYPEAICANFLLRKPMVQKIVSDWAWERATSKGWTADSFEKFQCNTQSLKTRTLSALRTLCVRRANHVIVPSRYLARYVINWGVSEKNVSVVYNAVELPQDTTLLSTPFLLPLAVAMRFKIVTVARLIPLKRVDDIIKVVAQDDRVGLVIVGDGSERRRLEALVHTYELEDRVCFTGRRDKRDTLSLMAACDIFVLNSTHEGLPHVVLEAMSVGLPVVATAVGGTPEVVEDGYNGCLLPVVSNGALSQVLTSLNANVGERRRLAKGAQETVARFNHEHMVTVTEAILMDPQQKKRIS